MKLGTPLATEWNALVDYLTSLRPAKSDGLTLRHTAHGIAIVPNRRYVAPGRSGGGVEIKCFEVLGSQTANDYWVCDESPSGLTNTNVYKPIKLRYITSETLAGDSVSYSSYGTDKMSRTATVGSDTEKQVIIPYVLTGDLIYAFYDETESRWQDLNIDARAWARKWDQS